MNLVFKEGSEPERSRQKQHHFSELLVHLHSSILMQGIAEVRGMFQKYEVKTPHLNSLHVISFLTFIFYLVLWTQEASE